MIATPANGTHRTQTQLLKPGCTWAAIHSQHHAAPAPTAYQERQQWGKQLHHGDAAQSSIIPHRPHDLKREHWTHHLCEHTAGKTHHHQPHGELLCTVSVYRTQMNAATALHIRRRAIGSPNVSRHANTNITMPPMIIAL